MQQLKEAPPPFEQLLKGDVEETVRHLKARGTTDYALGFISEFVTSLLSEEYHLEKMKSRTLAKKLFKYADLNLLLCQQFCTETMDKLIVHDDVKWKLVTFFVSLPAPNKLGDALINEENDVEKVNSIKNLHIYPQKAWLSLLRIEFTPSMYRLLLTHFIENVMDQLPNSELFADFLYKMFKHGNFMSVISIAGIFKLIVNRNFEHPNFYADVYRIIQPNICYSNYAQKFFDLVDLIMSSNYIPVYIVCAFVKRLCRVLLFAPVHCQLPIIQLIKNLLRRHASIHSLMVDRADPQTLDADPYIEDEADLQKCRAGESSLWELKAIQSHWYDKISTRANFINSNVQDEEMSLEWKTADELFDAIFERANIKLDAHKRRGSEQAEEDDEDEEEYLELEENPDEPLPKKRKPVARSEMQNSGNDGLGMCLFDSCSPWSC